MKVATIQFAPEFVVPLYNGDGDALVAKRGNLQRIAKLVQQAAEGGAKLVVLPELCTTGYGFMSREEAFPHCESLLGGPTTQVMKALATKYNVQIVWGMGEVDPGTGDLYNSQVYVDASGYTDSYRKINAWGNDYLWAKSGRANPAIIRSPEGKRVGLLICRDVRDKKDESWSNFYSPGEADIVCLSANWGDGGFPAVSWMDFAADNNVWLIVSNRYGQEGPNNFGEGGVCIISPSGAVQCEGLLWEKDCIVYGEIE